VKLSLIYVSLFATKAEQRNKAEERTHRQRQTDTGTLVHKTNLQYYPKINKQIIIIIIIIQIFTVFVSLVVNSFCTNC